LGGGLEADGSPNQATLVRAQAATDYYLEHKAAIQLIVYSGNSSPLTSSGTHPQFSEAGHMADYGEAHGVPADIIHRETRSRSTIGNLALTANVFASTSPVGIITGQGIMGRTLETVDRVWGTQFEVVPLPIPEPRDALQEVQEQLSTWAMRATLLGIKPGNTQRALRRTENFHRVIKPLAPVLRRTLHRGHPAAR
jgi:uncharacterized SAM-binding protein YcdF (DUF218 family)